VTYQNVLTVLIIFKCEGSAVARLEWFTVNKQTFNIVLPPLILIVVGVRQLLSTLSLSLSVCVCVCVWISTSFTLQMTLWCSPPPLSLYIYIYIYLIYETTDTDDLVVRAKQLIYIRDNYKPTPAKINGRIVIML